MRTEDSVFPLARMEELAAACKGAIKIGPFGSQLRKEEMVQHGVKVYGQENLIAQDWSVGDRRISRSKYLALRSCELVPGDLVVTMMGTIGKCDVFPEAAEQGVMDSHLLRIQPDLERVDRRYLRKVMNSEEVVGRQLERLSHGSIMAGLSSSIVRKIEVPLPSLSEQRCIAEILDTLDEAIRGTERAITKLQQIKLGLLHDLLIRGIDKNGELRDPGRNPEGFRQSPLGAIPRKWEIRKLGGLCDLLNGLAFRPEDWGDEGLPIIRIQNLNGSPAFNFCRRPVPIQYEIPGGTILFSWSGNRGTSFGPFVWNGPRGLLNQHIFRVTPTAGQDETWFFHALDRVREQVERDAHGGSGLVHVRRSGLLNYLVPVPPVDEQKLIARAASAVTQRVDLERAGLQKLRQLRSGLSDDLLKGRIRVPLAMEAAR